MDYEQFENKARMITSENTRERLALRKQLHDIDIPFDVAYRWFNMGYSELYVKAFKWFEVHADKVSIDVLEQMAFDNELFLVSVICRNRTSIPSDVIERWLLSDNKKLSTIARNFLRRTENIKIEFVYRAEDGSIFDSKDECYLYSFKKRRINNE